MNKLLLTFAVVGIGLICYALRCLYRQNGNEEQLEEPQIEERTLAEVSKNWAFNTKELSDKVVNLRDISVIWREPEQEKGAPPPPRPTFTNPEIEQFFSDMVEKRCIIKGARWTVIVRLLKMLDAEGDCPSVVRKHEKEAERQFPEDTFSLLATVPLYRHTLRVARKCAEKVNQEVMLPDIFIISLAHDIGKLPSYQDRLYSTGDHPLVSQVVLSGIPEYASLLNRAELDLIVRGHHLIKPDNPLTCLLKQCDQEARNEELGALIDRLMEREKTSAKNGKGKLKKPAPLPAAERTAAKDAPSTAERREHPLGEIASEGYPIPVKQEIPAWFDADAILAAVRKRINQLEETTRGTRWGAISTNKGIVFVNPDGLWKALKEVSGNAPALLAADADEGTKRNILYTVVWELSRTKNAIVSEYVAAKYYTTQTTVVTGAGKGFTALLVPFRVEVFGETDASLEETKSSRLRQMVREIRPKQAEVETCVM